ncbi:VWA domain-containing protein [Haloplanus halophilus]|uniref:VWA domain-containing protein n=1 Tax=Haloplanus halophilus TaxID=2949993 RepID=UPI002040EA3A|nr:VWA domain-containing protein [Haloplanus sp. GDY1]
MNAPSPGDDALPLADVQDRVRTALVRFVSDLRTAGVDVPADGALVGAEALAVVGVAERSTARTALRSALLSRPEDAEAFDRLFDRFWGAVSAALDEGSAGGVDASDLDGGLSSDAAAGDPAIEEATADREPHDGDGGRSVSRRPTDDGSRAPEATDSPARFSPTGSSAPIEAERPSFGDDPGPAVRALTAALADRPGRRSARAADGRPDLRRAMRRSHATGGVVMDVPERAAQPTTVRGLVLVDVSRSVLDTVDRDFLIDVLRTLDAEWRSVRTFLFDTDVTEVTGALGADSTAAVLEEFDRLEAAWGGGTRIGDALTTVRDRAPTAVDRETVVLIVSDGLETGDLDRLEDGMAWLDRRARRVFWLNPLAASTAYEPATRGMVVARSYLDGLFAFADPADLFDLARQLRRRRQPVGYEHDWRRNDTR